jgi:hypothetical protein
VTDAASDKSETNTATATFLGKTYFGTADVDFNAAIVTPADASITVTDTNQVNPLGTGVTGNQTFNYPLTATCDGAVYNDVTNRWEKKLPNTAQIVETGQNDDADVLISCLKDGNIIIEKLTNPPGDPALFNFTTDFVGPFSLGHGMTKTVPVSAGSYKITETVPATGWDLTDVSCVLVDKDTDPIGPAPLAAVVKNPKSVTVGGGETWKCTFTNTKWGDIVVKKIAPDKTDQLFQFTGAVAGSIAHNGQLTANLPQGPYTVTEVLPLGWTLRNFACDSDGLQGAGAVDPNTTAYPYVLPGLTTTCVFTNSLPSIVITKTATPEQVPNPGSDVLFAVSVLNSSKLDPVTITSLADSVYGDVTTVHAAGGGFKEVKSTTCALGTTLQPGGTYNCQFTAYVQIADDATVAFEETDVVTAKGLTDFQVEVQDDDDAKVVVPCVGNIIKGTVFHDPNINDILDPGEFPFKTDPSLPAEQRIETLVELQRLDANGNIVGAQQQVTVNGQFSFTKDFAETDYTLRVGDAALSSFGFQPSNSSLDFNAAFKTCVPYVKDFGYSKVKALIGDYVWYDANVNEKQDEWYDADGNGAITKNTGVFSISQWEFVDFNANGIADLPEELNTCAIGGLSFNSATGPNITIAGPAPQKRIRPIGATGYYRYNNIDVGDNTGPTVPLDPTETYIVSIDPFDAKLITGGVFYLGKQGQAISCKPIPAGSPVTPNLPAGGDPVPLVIDVDPNGSAEAVVAAATVAEGGLEAAATTPNCGVTTNFSTTVDLNTDPDGIYLDADFGTVCIANMAALGNRVWKDLNPTGGTTPEKLAGDGLQNDPAEAGVAGITVQLWGVGADGQANTADDVLADTLVTDANGNYQFNSVTPGNYYVVFLKPAGDTAWSSLPNVGSDEAIDSDVTVDPNNPNRAVTGVITLAPNTVDNTWDAAIVTTLGTGSSDLGNFVWDDKNKNGIQETGEPGVPNVKAQLFLVSVPTQAGAASPADTLLAEDVTDAGGVYGFQALDPGTYYVKFTVPTNYSVSPKDVGNNATDSDIDATGRTANIVLPVFTADLTWDAGIYVTPTADDDVDEPGAGGPVKYFLPIIGK